MSPSGLRASGKGYLGTICLYRAVIGGFIGCLRSPAGRDH